MKWYKHLVDSGDDPDIDDAVTLFGSDGYYIFFRTLEVMSREFDIFNPGCNIFSVEFLRRKYRIYHWNRVVNVLTFFNQRGRIYIEHLNYNGMPSIKLFCPKLRELTDEYTQKELKKKSGHDRDKIGRDSRIEEEEEEEKEEEKDNINVPSPKYQGSEPPPKTSPIFIEIPLKDKNKKMSHAITEDTVKEYETLFPAVDVRQVLRDIKAWNMANPTRQKTLRGIRAHITNWLIKEQNRGGRYRYGGNMDPPPGGQQDTWLQKKLAEKQKEHEGDDVPDHLGEPENDRD